MSVKTHPESPYYDDYDPNKGYVQVLARAGNYAQSREFTQIGTMFRDQIQNLGDSILYNGQIITGCDLVISGTSAILQPGRMYVDGLVRVISEPISCQILGVGRETVGVKIDETVVTANDDESLRNPAIGTEGYLQEGASRVRQRVILVANDPLAVNIYTLEDGVIVIERPPVEDNNLSQINGLLARRTYDTSGNFKVEGLVIMDKDVEYPDEEIKGTPEIYISAGKAYIHGYEVTLEAMRTLKLTLPTERRKTIDEHHEYTASNNPIYIFNQPLAEVVKDGVQSVVEIRSQMTRTSGTGNLWDEIPSPIHNYVHSPVLEINQDGVTDGTITYTQCSPNSHSDGDYYLDSGRIHWTLMGRKPSTGQTYWCTYKYKRTNVQGEDFQVYGTGVNQYIQFIGDQADRPIVGTDVEITYEFFLSRIDTICIDENANVYPIEGTPDKDYLCIAPVNNDRTVLALGHVLLYAGTEDKEITNYRTTRLTQSQLSRMKMRLEDVEMNQAQKDLDDEAKNGEDATVLKGIYTDGFVGVSKADITHPEFDCCLDYDMREMTVSYDISVAKLSVNQDASDANIQGRIVTSPYSTVEVLSQPLATSKFLVNPYAAYPREGILSIDPAVDNWIDENITVNEVTKENTKREKIKTTSKDKKAHQKEDVTEKFTETESVDTVVTYMRPITINLEGSNFYPDEDNIEIYFNENRITISNPSIVGSETNTVKADSKGRFSCRFKVPDGIPSGSAQVEAKAQLSNASTVFTSAGIIRNTTITNTTVIRKIEWLKPGDPLAQTFQFDRDTILTALDLNFGSKDSYRSVIIEVRDTVNGYPGTTIFTQDEVRPENIIVNGDTPTPTRINFSQPVYCEANRQYSFVVKSDSNVYTIWIANMGETDVISNNIVYNQPYMDGLMFSSSNGLAWTPHQMSDITFTLYKAKYNEVPGEVIFDNVTASVFDSILLAAETEDHKNKGIDWLYKLNDSQVWQPIDTFEARDMDELGNNISLKCYIKADESTSPMIANDCINLIYFKDKNSATYVSRTVTFDESYDTIKVVFEFTPYGDVCKATPYYQTEYNNVWQPIDTPESEVIVDREFKRYTFSVRPSGQPKSYKIKLVITTSNPLVRPRVRKLMSILKKEDL